MDEPVFIMSFDCEGKWGLADRITGCEVHKLTNQNLSLAYQRLVDILDKHGLKATFAFVGAFTMSFDEFQENPAWFKDIPINGRNWLARFRDDIANKTFDGWLNPEPFEIIRRKQRHEIASHGFTHLPLAENLVSEEAFLHEMECMNLLSQIKGLSFNTLVYPRNLVGYLELLGAYGLIGYRACSYSMDISRMQQFLKELSIRQRAQAHGKSENNVVKIPGGYFLNWRVRLRRVVPLSVTLSKWRHILSDSIRNNGVIHLYTHPQDFIDGKDQYQLLDGILSFVAKKQLEGEILNLTQYEYSKMILDEGQSLLRDQQM